MPTSYKVIRATWLSRKPKASAQMVALISTLLLVVLCQMAWLKSSSGSDPFSASYTSVYEHHEYWRAFTTLFVHGDWEHLGSNCVLFSILGFFLYGYFGSLVFPIGVLIAGVATVFAVLPSYDHAVNVIGASGVVYAMGGAWLVLYFFLHRSKNLWHRSLRTLGVALLLFMPHETFNPGISNQSHLVGFAFGFVLGFGVYFVRRSEFRAAEVRELVVEDDDTDPSDNLNA